MCCNFLASSGHKLEVLTGYSNGSPRRLTVSGRDSERERPNDNFYEMLREDETALILSDLHYMPGPEVATVGFTFIRCLGHRHDLPQNFGR